MAFGGISIQSSGIFTLLPILSTRRLHFTKLSKNKISIILSSSSMLQLTRSPPVHKMDKAKGPWPYFACNWAQFEDGRTRDHMNSRSEE